MTITDLGKDGPRPDLIIKLVESITALPEVSDHPEAQEWVGVTRSDIRLLQQRTVYDARWSNPLNDETGQLDISAGLTECTPAGRRKSLVTFTALRWPGRDWGIAQWGNTWLHDPPPTPWPGDLSGSVGISVTWAVIDLSGSLDRGRITLADGHVAESAVSDGSFLLLVPVDSYELWCSPMQLSLYDVDGLEVLNDSVTFLSR